jgi:thymidylate kinase
MAFFNNLRSLERKIGVYEILRGYPHNWIILVDEGPVLATHMFAFGNIPLATEEIARFASLLPLPDLLVYVKIPIDTLVQRTLERADPPRELGAKNRVQIELAVRGTEFLFDQLVNTENIRSRILIVDNSDLYTQDVAVDCIIEFIHEYQKERSWA